MITEGLLNKFGQEQRDKEGLSPTSGEDVAALYINVSKALIFCVPLYHFVIYSIHHLPLVMTFLCFYIFWHPGGKKKSRKPIFLEL